MRTFARTAVAGAVMFLALGSLARAQAPPDAWQFTFAPYLMAAGMNGTTGIGPIEQDVSLPASKIFSNLQFGAMGYIEARKGNWGVGADLIWMSLGSSTEGRLPTKVDMDQGGFTFVAIRRLSPVVDLRAGVLVNTLKGQIAFKQPIERQLSRTETWVDPVVGVHLHTPDTGGRWGLALMADIGGFGAGSDIMFNVEPVVVLRLTKGAGLAFGYRWIRIKYENAGNDDVRRFLFDMTSSGPTLGFVFRF